MSGGSESYGAIARFIPRNVEELPLWAARKACRELRNDGLPDVADALANIVADVAKGMCRDADYDEFALQEMGELLYVLDRVRTCDRTLEDRDKAVLKWRKAMGIIP